MNRLRERPRRRITARGWLVGASAAMLALAFGAGASAETADRIVAVVNDDAITASDVVLQAQAMALQQGGRPTPGGEIPKDLLQVGLQRLIEQRLIAQEGKRLNVTVSNDEVAEEFHRLRSQFQTDEEFHRSLDEGRLTEGQLKEEIHRQLIIQKVIDSQVRATVSMSPQELAGAAGEETADPPAGVPQVRVSHLLVRVGPNRSEEEARGLIEDISKRLSAGEPFADLARRYSEDSYAQLGGMMGWVQSSDLLPELAAALETLKPSERSQPIRTRLGFHLLQLEATRTAPREAISNSRERTYRQLYQQKFQGAFSKWLSGLKQRAYIEIMHGA